MRIGVVMLKRQKVCQILIGLVTVSLVSIILFSNQNLSPTVMAAQISALLPWTSKQLVKAPTASLTATAPWARLSEPVYNSQVYQPANFRLTGTSTWNPQSKSCDVALKWADLTAPTAPYQLNGGYKVYSSSASNASWLMEPINYGKHLKVLNVYPDKGNFLKKWLAGYDKDPSDGSSLLDITEVPLTTFNKNPDYYLYQNHQNGAYQYDSLFFGSKDSNGSQDISDVAGQAVTKFGNTGRAVIIGHDVVAGNHSIAQHANFNKYLADKLGIQVVAVPDGQVQPRVGSTKVKFVNAGFLTEYPNELPTDQDYTISKSHTFGQYYLYSGQAQRWMQFDQPYSDAENSHFFALNAASNPYELSSGQVPAASDLGDNNHYLITKNNYAMIQTGHTLGACTPDEARIIVNTIYYVSSLTTTNTANIKTAKDTAAPNEPDVTLANTNPSNPNRLNITLDKHLPAGTSYNSQDGDNGNLYNFKITANVAGMNEELDSDAIHQKVESGVWGYLYQIDNQPTATLTPSHDSYGNVTLTDIDRSDGSGEHLTPDINNLKVSFTAQRSLGHSQFLHVATVDRAGNVSTTKTVNLKNYNLPYQGTLTTTGQVGTQAASTTPTFRPGETIKFKSDYQMQNQAYSYQDLQAPISFSDHLPVGLTYVPNSLQVTVQTTSGQSYTLTPQQLQANQPLDFSLSSPDGATIFPPGSLIEVTFQATTSAQDNLVQIINHAEMTGTSSDQLFQKATSDLTLTRAGVLEITSVPQEIAFGTVKSAPANNDNTKTVGDLKVRHFSSTTAASQHFNVQVAFNQQLRNSLLTPVAGWNLQLNTDNGWQSVTSATNLGQQTQFSGNVQGGIVDFVNQIGVGKWRLTIPHTHPKSDDYQGTITWTVVNGLN